MSHKWSLFSTKLLWRQRWENCKFKASLGNLIRLCVKLKRSEESSVAEHLTNMCENIGPIPNTTHEKGVTQTVAALKSFNPALQRRQVDL